MRRARRVHVALAATRRWPRCRTAGIAEIGTPIAVCNDRHREPTLRAAGYVVLRYSWQQVTTRAAEVAADLRSALAAGARR